MTVLVGDPTFSSYTPPGPSGNDGAYLAPTPFVALLSGQANRLYAYLNPVVTQQFVMALYDGQNQVLAYSPAVTIQPNAGLTAFPIATTPIVAGLAYQIVLFPQGVGAFTFGTDTAGMASAFHSVNANATFPTPPLILSGAIPIGFSPPTFYVDGDAQAQVLTDSGVIGQFVPDVSSIIESAFNRCKIRSSVISDEMVYIARKELFFFLTGELANRGPQLFAVDIQLLPFTAGLAGVPMPAGTIDVLNVNLRQQFPLQSSPSPTFSAVTPTVINTVAITWGGPAVPVQVFQGNTVIASAQPNASAGQTTLIDLDGATASLAWTVQANPVPPQTGTAGVLNITNVTFFQTAFQVPLAPYSRDDFANLNNTFFIGRPYQFWLDRQEPWPIMRLWPTPGIAEQQNACLVIWRHRQVMDATDLHQKLDVPNRWLEAITDGLAERLARTIQEVDIRLIPITEARAMKSMNLARGEEREKAPMRIQPMIYRYTR